MVVVKIILLLALISYTSAAVEQDPEKRPTRTIARFLGFEGKQKQVQQQPQVNPNIPLVYNVRYYDRGGENPEVQVEQAQAQIVQQQQEQQQQQPQQQIQYQAGLAPFQEKITPSTRVFLNLYTGQQTPVYYDSKGQLYVPCPAYDHHHQVNSGPKPVVNVQKTQVGQPVISPPEYVYYSGASQQQQKQVHQQQQKPILGVVPPVTPYVTQIPVAPEVLYYTAQQQQSPKVVGYSPTSTVVTYPHYDMSYAYAVPSPYTGQVGIPIMNQNGQVVYQNGQGGYVNPFVYVKPAQVTVQPGPPVAHVHAHTEGTVQQQQQQQTDQVENKSVSEKSNGQ